jgi:hypothetical protein
MVRPTCDLVHTRGYELEVNAMPLVGRGKARRNTGWAKNRARDAEIVRRYGEGARLTALALAFNLSPTRIREIVLQHRGHQRGYGWSVTINPEL